MRIPVGSTNFTAWLPDSSGMLTQKDQYYLFDLSSRQLKPYLADPRAGSKRLMAVLPEINAALMQSGQDLFLIPQVSRFAAPGRWDMDIIENDAFLLGVIPEGITYYSADFMVSPAGNLLLVSDRPYQEDYYAHLYHMDGSAPVQLFSGIVPVAWSPDESAFLGIRFEDTIYRGSGNYSGTPHKVVYSIQPFRGGQVPAVIYSLPPTCGLVGSESSSGRSFSQSRMMLDCAFSTAAQDVVWK